jgi:hypothetical protein
MHLIPGHSIEVTNVSSWQDRLVEFKGSFVCEPTPGGTRVTHRYVFDFKEPARWILEPYLRTWMANDIIAEVARIKQVMRADSV